MPDADGLALAAKIRERAELAATRIILLTSGDRPGDPARSRELRIDAHLLKPVQQDELLETIYRVMSRSQGNAPPLGPAHAHPASRPRQSRPRAPLHILVAEDNEFNAQSWSTLVRQGHRVRLASNGREVLALAEQGGFDLLLLDVHMPELDGFQVVRAVRERERTAGGHLPVIALTARSRKEDRERCLAAGMDDFLTKPIQSRRPVGGHRPGPQDSLISPIPQLGLARRAGAVGRLRGRPDPAQENVSVRSPSRVPEHLAALREALRDQDAPRLREAAHKCCGMLSEFSTAAGDLAGNLEELAAGSHLDEAARIVERLEAIAPELVHQLDGITVEALRH